VGSCWRFFYPGFLSFNYKTTFLPYKESNFFPFPNFLRESFLLSAHTFSFSILFAKKLYLFYFLRFLSTPLFFPPVMFFLLTLFFPPPFRDPLVQSVILFHPLPSGFLFELIFLPETWSTSVLTDQPGFFKTFPPSPFFSSFLSPLHFYNLSLCLWMVKNVAPFSFLSMVY